tara:strand:- start:3624 stop:3965 length:342 start_codon:yes stop_codon:yes gene_type:complete
MKQFQEKIPFITLVLLFCTFLYTCSSNRTINKVEKENKTLILTVDSLKSQVNVVSDSTISITQFQILLELEGYKQSSRNLYHDNAIIRTKERPDDVMHSYNKEIEKLTKKLNN